MLPSEEMIARMQAYHTADGNFDELSLPERFVLTVANVPQHTLRARGFLLRATMREQLDGLHERITLVDAAAHALCTSRVRSHR